MILAEADQEQAELVMDCVVLIFAGLVFIGLALPMVLRKIPPNKFYGWRTPKAYSSPEIWYQINWYSGRDMLFMGLILAIFNAILFCFSDQLQTILFWLMVPGNLTILLGGTIVMIVRGFIYLGKL